MRFRAFLSFCQICELIVQINIQFIDAKILLLAIKSILLKIKRKFLFCFVLFQALIRHCNVKPYQKNDNKKQ